MLLVQVEDVTYGVLVRHLVDDVCSCAVPCLDESFCSERPCGCKCDQARLFLGSGIDCRLAVQVFQLYFMLRVPQGHFVCGRGAVAQSWRVGAAY